MTELTEQSREKAKTGATRLRAVRGIVTFIVFTLIWFGIAGRLDWIQGWAFLLLFLAYVSVLGLWLRKADPGLLAERSRRAEDAEAWDKAIMRWYGALVMAVLIVAALDAGRFNWSAPPIWLQGIGWGGLAVAAAAIWHVMAVNSYASRVVRIQEDRGHAVVTSGLYQYVRHPMYDAIIVFFICIPLVLGSLWALIPGALVGALIVYRTAREDEVLRRKLGGYPAYMEQVRYRLIPGVW